MSSSPLIPLNNQREAQTCKSVEAPPNGIESIINAQIKESTQQISHALYEGDIAPDFTLQDTNGKDITLSKVLKNGVIVLTWYRGGWCPYCNSALQSLQNQICAIHEANANLIAITPELPENAFNTKEKNRLSYPLLSDINYKTAKQYGLSFQIPPAIKDIYSQFFDLREFNGTNAGIDTLPLTATYVIGRDRKILWSFLDADYRNRPDTDEIVSFLENIK